MLLKVNFDADFQFLMDYIMYKFLRLHLQMYTSHFGDYNLNYFLNTSVTRPRHPLFSVT